MNDDLEREFNGKQTSAGASVQVGNPNGLLNLTVNQEDER